MNLIDGLCYFSTNPYILVMDSFILLAIDNGVLDASNHFHVALCSPHAGADTAGFLFCFLQCAVQLFQRKNLMLVQRVRDGDKRFQILARSFLLSVLWPVSALRLSQIEIIPQQIHQIGRGVLRRFLCEQLLSGFQNIVDPVTQILNVAANGSHHAVSILDVPVQITDIGQDATALHLVTAAPTWTEGMMSSPCLS